jgi:hypothetical protein
MIPLCPGAIYVHDFIVFSAVRGTMPYFGAQIGWPTPGRRWFRRGLNVLYLSGRTNRVCWRKQ